MASYPEFAEKLSNLVRKFDSDRVHYVSSSYSEAQARLDFITPFFKALGWDLDNDAGLPHHERDSVVERGETEGRPDYNFRIRGQTRFFVEAKAPHESLDDPRHIVQAKAYAWNTKEVFFVCLTDFKEFRFYDASMIPDERKPNEGLLLQIGYSDYVRQAAKLWEFAKDNVAAGSLELMLPRDRRLQRLRIPVDEAFLEEMTEWRGELAKDVHKKNPDLSPKQLNEVVQRLLDRIVFVRIAEDRRIIERHQLADAVAEWKARRGKLHIFQWLNPIFHTINEDFNGEIFKPHLSETIDISSEVLTSLIERLYPPKSPYRFDVIGVELLGAIYERYLGKTVRPTEKQVKVEDKPEVRKAGGVYYTPRFIVDYIVKNTVGPLVEGKTPRQIEKLRILDPACGSGSFLIGAFQYLIDYHVRYLTAHPKAAQNDSLFPDLMPDGNGGFRLSVTLKAKLLRNNLYGVDIDPQAVEITMMSLYLKALEGEKSQLPPRQSVLPELKFNIICGNSLVGPEIYDQGALFVEAERDRINAFDWRSESRGFRRTMENGGFDCVLANPPYIRIQMLSKFSPEEASYVKKSYGTAKTGNVDIYVPFVEKGLEVLRPSGRLGFILPSKFFQTDYGSALRTLLLRTKSLAKIVDFGHAQVFDGPTTYTCLLFLERGSRQNPRYVKVADPLQLDAADGREIEIPLSSLSAGPWVFTGSKQREIHRRLAMGSRHLLDLPTSISRGSSTGDDEVFILRTGKGGQFETRAAEAGETVAVEAGLLRVPLYASDFGRYQFDPACDERVIFPYLRAGDDFHLMTEGELEHRFPQGFRYLLRQRRRLEKRKQFTAWYGFSASRNLALHDSANLLVPLLADRGLFSLFPKNQARFCLMASGGFSLTPDPSVDPRFLLGLLNSKLLFFSLKSISNVFRGGWITCTKQYVGQLPIKGLDAKAERDRVVALVERVIKGRADLSSPSLSPSDREEIENQVAKAEAQIDDLVYRLYGVNREEQKLIEDELEPRV